MNIKQQNYINDYRRRNFEREMKILQEKAEEMYEQYIPEDFPFDVDFSITGGHVTAVIAIDHYEPIFINDYKEIFIFGDDGKYFKNVMDAVVYVTSKSL